MCSRIPQASPPTWRSSSTNAQTFSYEESFSQIFLACPNYIDGLVPDGKGNYLPSDFHGAVYLNHPGKEKIKLLDTTPIDTQAADITFIIEKKLLLVPTFTESQVVAYELK
jgi:hypothetical protein